MRVPIRGTAVLHSSDGPLHAAVENLSQTGALLNAPSRPYVLDIDVELLLDHASRWSRARMVRLDPVARRWRIAVAFESADPPLRAAIDAEIESVLAAARKKPILVIDDYAERRATLVARLAQLGMTPLAPKTALGAIDVLSRARLHVGVCLLARGFGVASSDLGAILDDNFPWVRVAHIDDDLDVSIERARTAWDGSPLARLTPGPA